MKAEGALVKPKDITSHSYNPWFVLKVVFRASCSTTLPDGNHYKSPTWKSKKLLSPDPIDC